MSVAGTASIAWTCSRLKALGSRLGGFEGRMVRAGSSAVSPSAEAKRCRLRTAITARAALALASGASTQPSPSGAATPRATGPRSCRSSRWLPGTDR